MIRRVSAFYSYLFQEEQGITAAYFKTKTDTEYRVYFYPISEYFEKLSDETFLYRFGYFFGFTKLAPNEGKEDGKKFKRSNCFESWFNMADTNICFNKYDEEIIIKDANGILLDIEFLSLIIECNNHNIEKLLEEFQSLKEQLISDK